MERNLEFIEQSCDDVLGGISVSGLFELVNKVSWSSFAFTVEVMFDLVTNAISH